MPSIKEKEVMGSYKKFLLGKGKLEGKLEIPKNFKVILFK